MIEIKGRADGDYMPSITNVKIMETLIFPLGGEDHFIYLYRRDWGDFNMRRVIREL